MVTFNCEVCNATVPKKNTEKHYYRCPNAFYTCIDCSKTFEDGVSYKQHIQCLTEDEKYQGALYKGPKSGKQPGKSELKNDKDHSSAARMNDDTNKSEKAQKEGRKQSKKNTCKAEKNSESIKLDSDKHSKSKVSKKPPKTKDSLELLRAELRSGESLYGIFRSIDKGRKKELLKHLVVDEEGIVTLK